MPTRKGPGKEKGKGKAPAPKQPSARPREPDPYSGSEDEGQLVMARILSRLDALESRKKATRGEGSKAVGKQGARKAGNQPNKQLQLLQSIEVRLDALESGEGEATGSMENASRNTLDADVRSFGGALLNSRPSSQGASQTFSTPPMEPWILEAEEAIRLSLAPSTRVRYASAVHAFHAFRVDTGLKDLWPIPADFQVRRMLEGLAREHPPRPDMRVPLAPTTLQQTVRHLLSLCGYSSMGTAMCSGLVGELSRPAWLPSWAWQERRKWSGWGAEECCGTFSFHF
ncbi:uncharacterized protein LOC128349017 isoform X1 [Hemicordylus capensis]|uniref:uncharacterized protein LOC128349017 isoform X1 n=1 Tax=Hemicordylus capensis TaxID=884348 RepID=UPI0023045E10|nr:uncharacterized protein LOC128349017 isoform X1 [Hemicordylus capensis]XP_053160845.1 uncharacterized protein LOC128349017 isoform X1 [Hemicordylus capensis]XP_053160846.1 uncharacterized protein LOC128349017 isoform X1 [Hemicordylus capensis]